MAFNSLGLTKNEPEIDRDKLVSIGEILTKEKEFFLACHIRPDGDAIGSMLALGTSLMLQDKNVTMYCADTVPDQLKFLKGSDKITNDASHISKDTTLIILDCSEPKRIGPKGEEIFYTTSKRIVIDHHLSDEEPDVTICYQDPSLFATGALIFWLLEELNWPIYPDIAESLYTAILTDTGCFRHNNTTELSFEMAKKLVGLGARPDFIAQMLYQNYPLRRLQLLALVLKTLDIRLNGKIATIHATPEMFKISKATEADSEDFVSYARCINTVEVAIFIREVHSGHCAVSLRSKRFFNVARVAKEFGGGGHFFAAGFRTTGTVQEVREKLLQRIEDLLLETDAELLAEIKSESGDV